jgi:hypothetical protein
MEMYVTKRYSGPVIPTSMVFMIEKFMPAFSAAVVRKQVTVMTTQKKVEVWHHHRMS